MNWYFLLAGCGLLLALSCQNQASEHAISNKDIAMDTASITGFTGDRVKLVKKAAIQIRVPDVQQGARVINHLTREAGGMVTYQLIETAEAGRKELQVSEDSLMVVTAYGTTATITARIPAAQLGDFLFRIWDHARFVKSSEMEIDDKTLDYLALQLKQENRKRILTRRTVRDTFSTREQLAVADELVDQGIQNRQVEADVRYSTVQLNLVQHAVVMKEMVADTSLAGYEIPFAMQMKNAFAAGWAGFLQLLLLLTHLWMFIVLAVLLWSGYKQRWYRKVA